MIGSGPGYIGEQDSAWTLWSFLFTGVLFIFFLYIYKREEEKKREEKKSGGRNEMGGGYDRGKAEGGGREDDSPRLCYIYITLHS